MTHMKNPILRGFHPDPTIVRVGDDYYLATSTFEWYPGVCIYHSVDLVNWVLVARPLASLELLDMRGNPDSCGVWAPCLSYHNERFYLAFTNTRRFQGDFKDTPNYLISSEKITGPWSTPRFINSSGFDPSLFHDDTGKSYWLNMIWDHRPSKVRGNHAGRFFGGISCQEIDLNTGKLLGSPSVIFKGSELGLAEGPHIFKKGNYYYLIVAEGGTDKDHAVTIARSETVFGPYELPLNRPLLSSKCSPNLPIKRSGHGDICTTPEGESILVHLCSRPLTFRGRSVMGRETALQKLSWKDGWPELASGANIPSLIIQTDRHPHNTCSIEKVDFKRQKLPNSYHSLRYPLPKEVLYYSTHALTLHGQQSLGSLFEQSLLARRQQSFRFSYTTEFSFSPKNFQQMAGLVCYYNSKQYYYLYVTFSEEKGRVIELSSCQGRANCEYLLEEPIKLPDTGKVYLKANIDHDLLHLAYKTDESAWHWVAVNLDYSILSVEFGEGGAGANFTGAFVGICCQDLSGARQPAHFYSLNYQEFNEGEVG